MPFDNYKEYLGTVAVTSAGRITAIHYSIQMVLTRMHLILSNSVFKQENTRF